MGATAYIESNGLHSAPDAMASEFEVQELLQSLVRLLKPKVCVETGCYQGHSTLAIAKALFFNQQGELFSCDTDSSMVADAYIRIVQAFKPANPEHVHIWNESGIDLCNEGCVKNVDFAFLDSSGDRVAEAAALQLSPKAVVVVHDTNRTQYDAIKLLHPWKAVWKIETPRGLTVFQL